MISFRTWSLRFEQEGDCPRILGVWAERFNEMGEHLECLGYLCGILQRLARVIAVPTDESRKPLDGLRLLPIRID